MKRAVTGNEVSAIGEDRHGEGSARKRRRAASHRSLRDARKSAWPRQTSAQSRQTRRALPHAKQIAAQANARALEAKLELEKFKAPRHIKREEFVKALEGKPKAPVEILFVRDDPECFQLAMQIRDALKEAKWDVPGDIRAIDTADTPRLSQYTSTMGVGGQPQGVTVVQRATSQADFDRERDNPFDKDAPIDTPRKALSRALMNSLGGISGGMSFDTGTPGVLRVVVGPKP